MITVVVGAVQGLTAARAVPGFFYASFASSEAAVLWAVGTQEALMEVDWPAELLEHPACEEMRVKGPEGSQPAFQTVYRGPRAKMGIYAGAHPGSIHQASGRTTYPGSIANRTARISSGAAAGEILAAREVVLAFEGDAGEPGGGPSAEDARGVRFLRIGEAKLKGVAEAVEIFAVGSELLAKRPVGRNKFATRSGAFVSAGDATSSGGGASSSSVSKSESGDSRVPALLPGPWTFMARHGPKATVQDNASRESILALSIRVGGDGAEE